MGRDTADRSVHQRLRGERIVFAASLAVVDKVGRRPIFAIHQHCLYLVRFVIYLLAAHVMLLRVLWWQLLNLGWAYDHDAVQI